MQRFRGPLIMQPNTADTPLCEQNVEILFFLLSINIKLQIYLLSSCQKFLCKSYTILKFYLLPSSFLPFQNYQRYSPQVSNPDLVLGNPFPAHL